jgi:nucleoside-diphosphate-sugar epimerase
MTRIAVTGGTGFVGRATVERLRHLAADVVSFRREDLSGADQTGPAVAAARSRLATKLSGCEALIHIAGLAHRRGGHEAHFDAVNHLLTQTLAQAAVAAGVRRIVFVSSIAVHGQALTSHLVTQDTPLRPTTLYGVSKARAEEALAAISSRHKVAVTIVRPPLVCGAGAPGNLALLRRAISAGVPLPKISNNRRDLIGVRNLAILLAGFASLADQTQWLALPVSDGMPMSSERIVTVMANGLGRQAWLLPMPDWFLRHVMSIPVAGRLLRQFAESLEVDGREAWRLSGLHPAYSTEQELFETGAGAHGSVVARQATGHRVQ